MPFVPVQYRQVASQAVLIVQPELHALLIFQNKKQTRVAIVLARHRYKTVSANVPEISLKYQRQQR